MSYTISSVANGVERQVLGGPSPGMLYEQVSLSSSIFNFTTDGKNWYIQDTSVNPPMFSYMGPDSLLLTNISGSPWTVFIFQNNTLTPIYNISDLPVGNGIPISIAYVGKTTPGGIDGYFWWVTAPSGDPNYPVRVLLDFSTESVFPPFFPQDYYKFYLTTYNNVITGTYNILASSDNSANIPNNNIITTSDSNISRSTMLLDFTKFPDVTVTTSTLCSPISVQEYKGYKISPTEFFFAENQTTIDIALESGNMQPNFIVLKSFNKNHAHIVKFKDTYLFISKETGISATTLENINKIATNNGYTIMYPLRNAINCPNINSANICGATTNGIHLYYNSRINPKQR